MRIVLLLVLLLVQVALADEEATAKSGQANISARLLRLFEEQLLEAPAGSDVTSIEAELDRLGAARLPRFRLSQRANWEYGGLVDLGIGASLSWGIDDPEVELESALTAKRLELARHNRRSNRASQLLELRRTLRLLVHLSEAEELLARHRQQLLMLRPEWRELEMTMPREGAADGAVAGGGVGAVRTEGSAPFGSLEPSAERLGYLEVAHALERTRRERSLLLLMVAEQVGLDPRELAGKDLGRPPRPKADAAACFGEEGFENAQTIRAELLLEESRLADQLDAARYLPQVTLDLSGNARYSNTSFARGPWSADVRLALQVAMPAMEGVSSDISLAVTPVGLAQELSVGWPGPSATTPATDNVAVMAYSRTVERARLNALRELGSVQAARDRLRLRRAELALVRSGPTGGTLDLKQLNDAAQAELALLNAQLELDLALMDVAANCDGA